MWPAVRRGSLHGNAVNLGSRTSAALRVPAPSSHKRSLTHDHENFTAYRLHDLHKKNSFRDHGAAIPYAEPSGPYAPGNLMALRYTGSLPRGRVCSPAAVWWVLRAVAGAAGVKPGTGKFCVLPQ